MKKILVTGGNGQLGSSINKVQNGYEKATYFYTDVADLDITNEPAVRSFVVENEVDYIINCAAYTAVDKAEEEFELAKKINATGPGVLAKIAAENNATLFHISTDYVFDGKAHQPYQEDDVCMPPSAYGKSKLLGEEQVLRYGKNAAILRTSWLYSEFGHNFLKTMIKYGNEREELKVVFDQIGSPTYASRLAKGILCMIHSNQEINGTQIYHFSNEGVCSWYDFALEIMKACDIDCKITPIQTFEYPLPAPRPFYSVLNKAKVKKDYQMEIPHWREDMLDCIKALDS
jgi:dTDP-4-dehydrorhamnose reductase